MSDTDIQKSKITHTPLSIIPTEEERITIGAFEDLPFLPSMQILQALSKASEEEKNEVGDFFIASKELNLGPKVEVVIAGRRPHALLLQAKKKIKETFDYNSPLFEEIAHTKDDRPNEIVAFNGLGDWLFFLPKYELYITYFCGRGSTRPLTNELLDYLTPPELRITELSKEKPYTDHFELYSHWETKMWGDKFKSWRPKSTPLEKWDKKPDILKLKEACRIFYNPVENEIKLTKTNDIIDR